MENLTLPFILVVIGMATMLTGSCIGSAIGVTNGANALIGGLKKNADIFGKGMILAALPATQGLYGFAAFFLYLLKVREMLAFTYMQGVLVCAVGIALGLVGYISASWQSKISANSIVEMSNGQDVFGKSMILIVFPELYAILAFASAFLVLVFML
ncbi:MAG: V-type ATP synthase subunit K [Bacteroidales bacterium]|nr:V-type ATP synthase subunit K [Bacteroidales bacterium]MCL2133731.1 V-type ATP synthase subunit K [Bacteroidales bacterium]